MFRLANVLFMPVTILLACISTVPALPVASAQTPVPTVPQERPVAPVAPVIDDYHGIKVSDPYRYMEKLDDPTVQSWFKGQSDYTRSALARIPGRDKLIARIKELDQTVPRIVAIRLPGEVYLIFKATAGRQHV